MKQAINWLTKPRIMAALWLAMLAWIWNMATLLPGFSWAWVVVVACVVAGAGLLLRLGWARWLAIALLSLAALNYAFRLATNGLTSGRLLAGFATAWLAWSLWKRPEQGHFDDEEPDTEDPDPEPAVSLVLLRSSPRYLEPVILAHALSNAWGLKIYAHHGSEPPASPTLPGYDGFVADTGPFYIAFVTKPSNAFFVIHNHEANYFDDPEAMAAKVPNLRFRDVIRNHQAWLSVDLLDNASPAIMAQAYHFIGKAISALADDATLALLCPQQSYFNLWSEALDEKLCGPDPLSAFKEEVKAPIIGVKEDSGVAEATAEARRRWPEFAEAFQRRGKDGGPFIVKAPFTTGDHTEHMWLEVFALEPEYVHGHLANDPFYHPTLKKGSQVEVPVTEVSDWVFPENDEPVGNFTGRIVNQARRAES
jgi:uncharacterized protein YegJ (DUF2314 family)